MNDWLPSRRVVRVKAMALYARFTHAPVPWPRLTPAEQESWCRRVLPQFQIPLAG